jgi:hypothetical protein
MLAGESWEMYVRPLVHRHLVLFRDQGEPGDSLEAAVESVLNGAAALA